MNKETMQNIIKKIKTGLHKLDIAMRHLTSCDEDIFINGTWDDIKTPKKRFFIETQRRELSERLSSDVTNDINNYVHSAMDPLFSELSMILIENQGIGNLNNTYKKTYKNLMQIPDYIDNKYEKNYNDIKAYTGLEIMKQTDENSDACEQLLTQQHIKQQHQVAKENIELKQTKRA